MVSNTDLARLSVSLHSLKGSVINKLQNHPREMTPPGGIENGDVIDGIQL